MSNFLPFISKAKPKTAKVRFFSPENGVQVKNVPFLSYADLVLGLPEGAIILNSRVN